MQYPDQQQASPGVLLEMHKHRRSIGDPLSQNLSQGWRALAVSVVTSPPGDSDALKFDVTEPPRAASYSS